MNLSLVSVITFSEDHVFSHLLYFLAAAAALISKVSLVGQFLLQKLKVAPSLGPKHDSSHTLTKEICLTSLGSCSFNFKEKR